ncbi:MAG: hypothetical protein SF052_09100 [Bacteroidia bacterium]|nr:hypothetical protein [Bacteroidia bacterium]
MRKNFTSENKQYLPYLFWSLIFLPIALDCAGQNDLDPAKEILVHSRSEMEKRFVEEHGGMTRLLHGRRFQAQYPFVKGSPFWFEGVWLPGTLQSEKYIYHQLPLQYDAYKDALVYFPDSFSLDMVLINPMQVVAFDLGGSTFVYLGNGPEKTRMEKSGLSSGYFELLYTGKTLLLAKRKKILRVDTNNTESYGNFASRTTWYIVKDDRFYEVEKKGEIVKLFPGHKKVLNSFWRENQVNKWKTNPLLLAKFLIYCDQL